MQYFYVVNMSTATKNIITELNKGKKLNGDNYEIWHCKVGYILEEQEAFATLNHIMQEFEQGDSAQHKIY